MKASVFHNGHMRSAPPEIAQHSNRPSHFYLTPQPSRPQMTSQQAHGCENNTQGPLLVPNPGEPAPFMAQIQRIMAHQDQQNASAAGAGPNNMAIVPANRAGPPVNMSMISFPSSGTTADDDVHPAIRVIRAQCLESHRRIFGMLRAARDSLGCSPEFKDALKVDLHSFMEGIVAIGKAGEYLQTYVSTRMADVEKAKNVFAAHTVENEQLQSQVRDLEAQLLQEREKARTLDDLLRRMREAASESNRKIQLTDQIERMKLDKNGCSTPADPSGQSWNAALFETHEQVPAAMQPFDRKQARADEATSVFMASNVAGGWNMFPIHSRTPSNGLVAQAQFPPAPPTPSRSPFLAPAANLATRAASMTSGQVGFNFESGPYGSPYGRAMSRSCSVPGVSDAEGEALAKSFFDKFDKVFLMVVGFARTYVKFDPTMAIRVQSQAPKLWEYMTDLLYPNRREVGNSHATFLLNEADSLPYFVARLVIQYLVNSVLTLEAWHGFDNEADRELAETSSRLADTDGCSMLERCQLLERQAVALKRILSSTGWLQFKQHKANFHSTRLKHIIGPLLPPHDGEARRGANADVFSVANAALELSAEVLQSRATFQYVWNETCSKFAVESHNAVNNTMAGMTLQLKQFRLKLVITPGIALRDERIADKGGAVPIVPKRVMKSQVLVMN